MERKKIIIGIVGPFGAGKTTASRFFQRRGFAKVRLSSFIEEELYKRGQKIMSRKLLQDVGNQLRKSFGPEILAKWALEKANNKSKHIVIDGIRNINEIKFLKKNSKFFLIGITAENKKRFIRIHQRKGRKKVTWKQFQKLELRERGLGQKITGLHAKSCFEMSDFTIENNGSRSLFYKNLAELLETLKRS